MSNNRKMHRIRCQVYFHVFVGGMSSVYTDLMVSSALFFTDKWRHALLTHVVASVTIWNQLESDGEKICGFLIVKWYRAWGWRVVTRVQVGGRPETGGWGRRVSRGDDWERADLGNLEAWEWLARLKRVCEECRFRGQGGEDPGADETGIRARGNNNVWALHDGERPRFTTTGADCREDRRSYTGVDELIGCRWAEGRRHRRERQDDGQHGEILESQAEQWQHLVFINTFIEVG